MIVKQSDTARTSTTTLAADPELVLPVVPGEWYVEMELAVSANTSGDFKTDWTSPSGTVGNRRCCGPGSGSADGGDDTLSRWGVHGHGTAVAYGARSGTFQFFVREAAEVTITTAGNITLRWAQNTSNANATTVFNRSLIRAWRIS